MNEKLRKEFTEPTITEEASLAEVTLQTAVDVSELCRGRRCE